MTAPLIGLVGAKRCGKDTVAASLVACHGFTRLAFADALKGAALATDPIVLSVENREDYGVGEYRLSEAVTDLGWEEAKEYPEVRGFLQRLGVAMRDHVDSDVWVNAVRDKARGLLSEGYGSLGEYVPGGRVVVTDVRFENEVRMIRDLDGIIVRVLRPGVDVSDAHVSEQLWKEVDADVEVVNDGTLADLEVKATNLALGLRVADAMRGGRL